MIPPVLKQMIDQLPAREMVPPEEFVSDLAKKIREKALGRPNTEEYRHMLRTMILDELSHANVNYGLGVDERFWAATFSVSDNTLDINLVPTSLVGLDLDVESLEDGGLKIGEYRFKGPRIFALVAAGKFFQTLGGPLKTKPITEEVRYADYIYFTTSSGNVVMIPRCDLHRLRKQLNEEDE